MNAKVSQMNNLITLRLKIKQKKRRREKYKKMFKDSFQNLDPLSFTFGQW